MNRILVIGDAMLDCYWLGSATRVSPEAPVPIFLYTSEKQCLGGCGNVANNLVALGAQVAMFCRLGDDQAGEQLTELAHSVGIEVHRVGKRDEVTTKKTRLLVHNHQMMRIDQESNIPQVIDWAQVLKEQFTGVKVVVLSDYNKGVLRDAAELIALCAQHGVLVIVDPKAKDCGAYRGADWITPNIAEMNQFVGVWQNDGELAEKVWSLCAKYSLKNVLLTRSEHGMRWYNFATTTILDLPSAVVEVSDVTGAGDTVVATLAFCLARGDAPPVALEWAKKAAALAVAKVGTATVSNGDLFGNASHNYKFVGDWQTLKSLCGTAQTQGRKIVFTNGCFDVLHVGHAQYLAQAKKLGDILVVALNSDASVQRLKGATRPIHGLPQRAALLGYLGSVDYVTSFESDTPCELVALLQPDVLVKGGDYTSDDQVVCGDIVKKYGGKVQRLGVVAGVSSTQVIRTIVERQEGK